MDLKEIISNSFKYPGSTRNTLTPTEEVADLWFNDACRLPADTHDIHGGLRTQGNQENYPRRFRDARIQFVEGDVC